MYRKLDHLIGNKLCGSLWGGLENVQVPNIWQKFYMNYPELENPTSFLQDALYKMKKEDHAIEST